MRPYLAIIKDSFREALASRVLWVLLLLITVLLVGLIPFHWVSTIAASMRSEDVRSTRNIANVLKAGDADDATPLQKHLWDSLSDRTRKELSELDQRGPRQFRAREILVKDFNKIIEKEDFYSADTWGDTKLSERAEELYASANLSGDSLKQFNRLALEAALPGQLRPCPDEAMMFRYAKWDMDFVPPFRRKLALEMIDTFVMAFMGLFVGVVGIFAAVLVTAPIIPNMLDSGSLYVLLSKPIARPFLFIAKFVGGCSFVLINAAYLIVGLCLILGFRFGVWKPTVLWSIPIFLFTFAIFYTVSTLSGLFWRSTVMAIVATMLFWFLCKTVATTKDLLEQLVIIPNRIETVVQQDGMTFITRKNGDVGLWNEQTGELQEIFKPKAEQNRGPEMMMGPSSSIEGMVYDKEKDALIALDRKWSQANIITGTKAGGWQQESSETAPRNARALFRHKGRMLAVADDGVFEVSTKLDAEDENQLGAINIFGLKIAEPPKKELYANVSEGLGGLPGDVRIAFDSSKGDIFIHGARELKRVSEVDGTFRETESIKLELDEVTRFAASGGTVVIAHKVEDVFHLQIIDGDTLQLGKDIDTANNNDVRTIDISEDGQWVACLFDNDQLELFDLSGDTDRPVTSVPAQGSIASAQFTDDGLLIADGNDRLLTLSFPGLQRENVENPKLAFIHQLYRYLIKPLYLVCPKPAELQNTMQYAITGKDTVKVEGPGFGPGGRTIKLNPWQPLVSNSIFIGVMLLIGCIYVYRQDF